MQHGPFYLHPMTRQRNLADEFDLTIIHTNDVHAHFLESDARLVLGLKGENDKEN